jgi:hypothetical protein
VVVYYRLSANNIAVRLAGEIEYFRWLDTLDKSKRTMVHVIVAQDEISDIFIGTYFLGSDRYMSLDGHLWQTMVYQNDTKIITMNYDSHCDAINGHRHFVEKFKSLLVGKLKTNAKSKSKKNN